MRTAAAWRRRGSPTADADVTQGRLTQDQKEQQGDRAEQEVRSKPTVGQEEPEDEADQQHQERGNGGDVHEFVLQVVAGKELAQPVLEAGTRGATIWRRRRWSGHRVRLGFAAEAAEVCVRLDRTAAHATEDGPGFWSGVRGRQGGPIIGPAIGPIGKFGKGVTKRRALPFDR